TRDNGGGSLGAPPTHWMSPPRKRGSIARSRIPEVAAEPADSAAAALRPGHSMDHRFRGGWGTRPWTPAFAGVTCGGWGGAIPPISWWVGDTAMDPRFRGGDMESGTRGADMR